MTNTEVQEKIKVGDYGLIKFDRPANRKQFHGKVKYIDSSGTLVFKDNDSKLYLIAPEKIVSFEAKDMLPKPIMVNGEEVYWTGGRYYYKKDNKECDIKR